MPARWCFRLPCLVMLPASLCTDAKRMRLPVPAASAFISFKGAMARVFPDLAMALVRFELFGLLSNVLSFAVLTCDNERRAEPAGMGEMVTLSWRFATSRTVRGNALARRISHTF